jgi:ABC-type transport system involved in multi-copper enzyme maturation permease subunit
MSKILAIAWKEVYVRFTDRNLVLLMIVTPLALSSIIGLAFSQLGNNDVPVDNIPVAVVNLDRGGDIGFNFGEVFLFALVPGAEDGNIGGGLDDCGTEGQAADTGIPGGVSLFDLTEATDFGSEAVETLIESGEIGTPLGEPGSPEFLENAARMAVEAEIYTAAVIIPQDFTESVSFLSGSENEPSESGVLVYADGSKPISSGIIHSIAAGITSQIISGNIKLAATFGQLFESGGQPSGSVGSPFDFSALAPCAFQASAQTIQVAVEKVEGFSSQDVTQALFVRFGSAQAMFFGLFTAGFGVLSMYDERRNWTLQRLVISPTPRSSILTGKLAGIFLAVLFQITVLLIAMTAVASVVAREPTSIWGVDFLRILIVTLAAAFSVTGFGMFIAGIARTPEQGQILNSVFAIGLAVLGGGFGFILPPEVSRFSLIYWGRTAFEALSYVGGDVLINVVVLIGMGLFFFIIGLYFFNRRFDMTE